MTDVLIRERRERFETQRHRGDGHVETEVESRVVQLTPRMPSEAGREAWIGLSSEPLKGTNSAHTLILNFWPL